MYKQDPNEKFSKENLSSIGWPWHLLITVLVVFGFVGILYLGLVFGYKPLLKSEIKSLDEQMEELKKTITAEEEKDFVNFYSQVINTQSLLGKHSIGSKVLPLLERTTNQRMFFKSISLTIPERKIVLEGVADSYETIASQLANYEATPEVERVGITAMQSSSTDGKVYFTASMLVAPSLFRDIVQSQ